MLRGFLTALWLFGCAAQAAPRVEAQPARVVLGRDGSVRVRVLPEQGGGALRWSTSSGQLLPAGEEDGAAVFLWTPPEFRYPSRGLLVFWQVDDGRTPDPVVLEIPLLGRTELEMDTEPGAEVRVRVGDATFGPILANQRGRVRVPIEVPPGIREAQVIATIGGLETNRTVPLEVPITRPVAVSLATESMSPDGGHLIVAHPESVATSAISISAENAQVEPLSGRRELSLFRVTPSEGASEIALSVRVLQDEPQSIRARVVAPPPTPEPTEPTEPAVPTAAGRLALQAQVGVFAAGGANLGPTLELGAAWRLPFWGERLSVEVGAGFRTAGMSQSVVPLGLFESRLYAVPIFAAVRGRLFSRGDWALDARGGLGAVPFRHAVSAAFQPSLSEGGIGFDAFAGAQGSYRLSSLELELLLDVRGEWTRLRTPNLIATPGGLVLGLGARWALP